MLTIKDELSLERKELQEKGELPDWFTTAGWQVIKGKYLYGNEKSARDMWLRVSNAAAKHLPDTIRVEAESKFFELFWKGWLAGSTPVLTNMGTDRGCPVSCSGGYVGDSISQFYSSIQEAAVLSKNGFGTSGYLGDIRPRGSDISAGGKASGIIPVLEDFVTMAKNVSQGGVRRGAWAGYIPIDHPDFWEILDHVKHLPDDVNIGWIFTDEFEKRLDKGDEDAIARWQAHLQVKLITGKGYHLYIDKVNRQNPEVYKIHNKNVVASNLCSEIMLFSDEENTFTCVLSSMNAEKYDEWKDTDAVYWATIFLDCVAQEFINFAESDPTLKHDLRKAIKFTKESRALGLGLLGFHSYLQKKEVAFEELQAQFINNDIFKHLHDESLRASQFLAKELGESELCKGLGIRGTHLIAVAPNTSSAMICGGVSQGIEPIVANVYNQNTASGEVARINPVFLEKMKMKGYYNKETIDSINNNKGSVQHLDWLTEHEKQVFKTAYEINQEVILRLASQRQKYIDQGQSLNLFISDQESEEYISKLHKIAYKDPNIKALYYLRAMAGVQASKGECLACEG